MRASSESESEILRLIYDDLLGRDWWPRLLARLTREFDSTYAVLLRRNRQTDSIKVAETDVLETERRRVYEDHYARLSPASFFCSNPAVGEVLTDKSYHDYNAYLRSELYNDFFRPLRAEHLMFMPLRRSQLEEESLVVRRSEASGFYDTSSVRCLKRLSSHLCNAERLRTRMRAADHRTASLSAMLDRLGTAAFVTDRAGRLHHMTRVAERLLHRGDMFAMSGGRLTGCQPAFDRELRAAVRDSVDSLHNPDRNAWRMLRADQQGIQSMAPTVFVSALVWTDTNGAQLSASLVVVNDPRDHLARSGPTAAGLFGLTRAESGVTAALCDGRSLSEYATAAGISVLTARTLLKRAQDKTGTHSQAELVGLLLRTGALL